MWEPLRHAASQAGFRVVAFDQRGYSPGARPVDVGAYVADELLDDIAAVADAVGFERFHLIGHDWGAVLGWNFTGQNPDRVLSWASLSIAHPGAILAASESGGPPTYIKVFRVPGLMETVFGFGDRLLMRKGLYPPIPASDLEEYLALFAEPGALTAGLNWYRAQEFSAQVDATGPVSTRTLWIYGSRDMKVFTGPRVRARMPEFVTGPYDVLELDAGHWLIQERPEAVVDALMSHLVTSNPTTP
jgi:pimeloyl-ACP methyl ester carboxylesterase